MNIDLINQLNECADSVNRPNPFSDEFLPYMKNYYEQQSLQNFQEFATEIKKTSTQKVNHFAADLESFTAAADGRGQEEYLPENSQNFRAYQSQIFNQGRAWGCGHNVVSHNSISPTFYDNTTSNFSPNGHGVFQRFLQASATVSFSTMRSSGNGLYERFLKASSAASRHQFSPISSAFNHANTSNFKEDQANEINKSIHLNYKENLAISSSDKMSLLAQTNKMEQIKVEIYNPKRRVYLENNNSLTPTTLPIGKSLASLHLENSRHYIDSSTELENNRHYIHSSTGLNSKRHNIHSSTGLDNKGQNIQQISCPIFVNPIEEDKTIKNNSSSIDQNQKPSHESLAKVKTELNFKHKVFQNETSRTPSTPVRVEKCRSKVKHKTDSKLLAGPITTIQGKKDCKSSSGFIERRVLVIGDSTAEQLASGLDDKTTSCLIENSLSALIRRFKNVQLSNKIKIILIVLGRDEILANESIGKIREQCKELLSLCHKYPSITTFWIPPPYIHSRANKYNEFVQVLTNLLRDSPIRFLSMTSDFRCFPEIFRYGRSFQHDRVDASGRLVKHGVRYTSEYLRDVFGVPLDIKSRHKCANNSRGVSHLHESRFSSYEHSRSAALRIYRDSIECSPSATHKHTASPHCTLFDLGLRPNSSRINQLPNNIDYLRELNTLIDESDLSC